MKKDCFNCHKEINLAEDKYVLVGTYNGEGKSKNDEVFFHFQCWIDLFNQAIISRIEKGQKMALGMLDHAMKGMNIKIQNG